MAADGKRKTTGALGVVLALALTVVVAGALHTVRMPPRPRSPALPERPPRRGARYDALRFRRARRADWRSPLARAHTVGGRRGERVQL